MRVPLRVVSQCSEAPNLAHRGILAPVVEPATVFVALLVPETFKRILWHRGPSQQTDIPVSREFRLFVGAPPSAEQEQAPSRSPIVLAACSLLMTPGYQ